MPRISKIEKVAGTRRALRKRLQRPQRVLASVTAATRVAKTFNATLLFVGHGANGQYKSLGAAQEALLPVIRELNRRHGRGRWLAVFGVG